jgi:uroporphyrinogen-III synthase
MESTLINPELPGGRMLTGSYDVTDKSDIDVLHEIGSRIAAADPLHTVLNRVVQFVSSMVACDSVFIYVLEGEDLVLRASKRPHADVVDRLTLRVGEGITGWVAEHRQPVAVGRHAFEDPRFQTFNELPEDSTKRSSVPVLSRGKLTASSTQHKEQHEHTPRDAAHLDVGFFVGARSRWRASRWRTQLNERLETQDRRARQGHPAARP